VGVKMAGKFILKMPRLPPIIQVIILHASKIYDMVPTVLLPFRKEGVLMIFLFRPENIRPLRRGFEPANFGF
jgi:hypothetical protein